MFRVRNSLASLVITLTLGGAVAHAQTISPNAAGSALSAPATARVAAPPSAPTVRPGAGADPATTDNAAALAAAIAARDIRRALNLGATPRDVAVIMKALNPDDRRFTEINLDSATLSTGASGGVTLHFTCGPDGQETSPGAYYVCNWNFTVAGRNPDGSYGDIPPPPPPSPAMVAIGQKVLAGASAPEAMAAIQAQQAAAGQAAPRPLNPLDPATAHYFRDGAVVGIGVSNGGSTYITSIPGTEAYPGLASLPSRDDLFPRRAGAPGPPNLRPPAN